MKNGRKWRVFVGLQFRMKRQTSSNKVRRFNRTMKILVKKKKKKRHIYRYTWSCVHAGKTIKQVKLNELKEQCKFVTKMNYIF